MRRRGVGRRGPGLVGTVARTAVVAGTASVAMRGANNMMDSRQQSKAQDQMDAAELQQYRQQEAQAAAAAQGAAQPPTAADGDVVSRLKELAELKNSGVLSDAEFQSAKAKLLAGG